MTRVPAHEVVEAAAWMAVPLALIGLTLWVFIARRSAKRDKQFAAETDRIHEQAHAKALADWKAARR